MNPMTAVKKVGEAAQECAKIREPHSGELNVNQGFNQGDVLVRRVGDDYPVGKETAQRQLAPGTTRGSRHIVEGDVKVFDFERALRVDGVELPNILHGPVLRVGKGGAIVTHPEHIHYKLHTGTYRVEYQRDWAMEEIERVRD